MQTFLAINIENNMIMNRKDGKFELMSIICLTITNYHPTPTMQSVMLGGGSLGLARPKSLFIFEN